MKFSMDIVENFQKNRKRKLKKSMSLIDKQAQHLEYQFLSLHFCIDVKRGNLTLLVPTNLYSG